MCEWWKKYLVNVPAGVIGDCIVNQFEVNEADARFSILRAAFSFNSAGRATPVGNYTALRINGSIMMSDTPDEVADLLDVFRYAKGRCLVNGLGLGVVVNGLLMKPEIEHVTVVEINPNVVELVGSHWMEKYGDRLIIIVDDAMTYKPLVGIRFDYVWHDIWPTICGDNINEMKHLHRRYGRRCNRQGSWCRNLCERAKILSKIN